MVVLEGASILYDFSEHLPYTKPASIFSAICFCYGLRWWYQPLQLLRQGKEKGPAGPWSVLTLSPCQALEAAARLRELLRTKSRG